MACSEAAHHHPEHRARSRRPASALWLSQHAVSIRDENHPRARKRASLASSAYRVSDHELQENISFLLADKSSEDDDACRRAWDHVLLAVHG
jgi:hypothetical protein